MAAGVIGGTRELGQYKGWFGFTKLNSPSLEDAIADASFTVMGGVVGSGIITYGWMGLLGVAGAVMATVLYSLVIHLVEGGDWS